jgi:hypothetical protein
MYFFYTVHICMTSTNLVTKRQVLIARWIVRIDPVTSKRTLISKWEMARCPAPTARPRRTCATTGAGPTGPRSYRSVTGAIQRSTMAAESASSHLRATSGCSKHAARPLTLERQDNELGQDRVVGLVDRRRTGGTGSDFLIANN